MQTVTTEFHRQSSYFASIRQIYVVYYTYTPYMSLCVRRIIRHTYIEIYGVRIQKQYTPYRHVYVIFQNRRITYAIRKALHGDTSNPGFDRRARRPMPRAADWLPPTRLAVSRKSWGWGVAPSGTEDPGPTWETASCCSASSGGVSGTGLWVSY